MYTARNEHFLTVHMLKYLAEEKGSFAHAVEGGQRVIEDGLVAPTEEDQLSGLCGHLQSSVRVKYLRSCKRERKTDRHYRWGSMSLSWVYLGEYSLYGVCDPNALYR